MDILRYKLLGLPAFIWVLQLLYVAVALGIFALIATKLNNRSSRILIQVGYVLLMLAVDIAWRITIKKLRPDWF